MVDCIVKAAIKEKEKVVVAVDLEENYENRHLLVTDFSDFE